MKESAAELKPVEIEVKVAKIARQLALVTNSIPRPHKKKKNPHRYEKKTYHTIPYAPSPM